MATETRSIRCNNDGEQGNELQILKRKEGIHEAEAKATYARL